MDRPPTLVARRVVARLLLQGTSRRNPAQLSACCSATTTYARADTIFSRRNASLIARINGLAPNPTSAVPAIQAAMRSYRHSESAARDLISTVWNILDRNLDGTASVVNQLVDMMDEEDKKRELLAAWNGFKIEVRIACPLLFIGDSYVCLPTATGTVP